MFRKKKAPVSALAVGQTYYVEFHQRNVAIVSELDNVIKRAALPAPATTYALLAYLYTLELLPFLISVHASLIPEVVAGIAQMWQEHEPFDQQLFIEWIGRLVLEVQSLPASPLEEYRIRLPEYLLDELGIERDDLLLESRLYGYGNALIIEGGERLLAIGHHYAIVSVNS